MRLEVVAAEALVVGPDEVLVLLFSEDAFPLTDKDGHDYDPMADLSAHLKAVGLEDRVLVIFGEAELSKVSRSEAPLSATAD